MSISLGFSTMSTPDFRALCEKLLAAYAGMNPYMKLDNAMKAARAALATEPVGEGPKDEELDSEVADSVEWLGVVSEQFRLAGLGYEAEQTDRVATLLQQLAAPVPPVVPIPASERLPGEGDCDAEGRCWWLDRPRKNGPAAWILRRPDDGLLIPFLAWLPAHAIPLPQAAELEIGNA
jgi:hypothetical protein